MSRRNEVAPDGRQGAELQPVPQPSEAQSSHQAPACALHRTLGWPGKGVSRLPQGTSSLRRCPRTHSAASTQSLGREVLPLCLETLRAHTCLWDQAGSAWFPRCLPEWESHPRTKAAHTSSHQWVRKPAFMIPGLGTMDTVPLGLHGGFMSPGWPGKISNCDG